MHGDKGVVTAIMTRPARSTVIMTTGHCWNCGRWWWQGKGRFDYKPTHIYFTIGLSDICTMLFILWSTLVEKSSNGPCTLLYMFQRRIKRICVDDWWQNGELFVVSQRKSNVCRRVKETLADTRQSAFLSWGFTAGNLFPPPPPANLPHDSLPSSSHASKHSPGQTATSGMQERHPSEQWEHTDVRRTSGNLLGKWDTQTSGACLEISWANGQIMRHGAQNDPSMRRFDTHHTSR